LFQRNARNGSDPQACFLGAWTWEYRFAQDKRKNRKRPMPNNPRDNNQNTPDRKHKANVTDPKRDCNNGGGRDQQQAEQGKQGQQGGQDDRSPRPDDKRDERKPQQR
jgi:hypothetical protein